MTFIFLSSDSLLINKEDLLNITSSNLFLRVIVVLYTFQVKVACTAPEKKWSATLTGIRKNKDIWDGTDWSKVPDNSLKMDVLMFGFDSLSRNSFIRKLPKSYEYLTQVLQGDVLKGWALFSIFDPYVLKVLCHHDVPKSIQSHTLW